MKLFLDCGRFDGVAIQQYCVGDSWDIYSFDVDPQSDLDLPIHVFNQCAVWIADGEVEVSLDPRKQASHIVGVAGTEYPETIKVPSIDFSNFIMNIPEIERYNALICSMDIEGSEFPVLRKMIADGSIQLIDVLDIEFHHRMMNDEDTDSARALIQEIDKLGIIVRLKVVL